MGEAVGWVGHRESGSDWSQRALGTKQTDLAYILYKSLFLNQGRGCANVSGEGSNCTSPTVQLPPPQSNYKSMVLRIPCLRIYQM